MSLEIKSISKHELKRKVSQAGYDFAAVKHNEHELQSLLTGELCFTKLPNGIALHFGDIKESSNSVSSCEIEDLVSFNLLFSGKLSFAINEKKYTFDALKKHRLFINTVNGKQAFSRFLIKDNQVKKLNLSVSKEWLQQRCTGEQDKDFIASLFKKKHNVFELSVSEEIIHSAIALFKHTDANSIRELLLAESKAMILISNMLGLLQNDVALKVTSKQLRVPKSKKAYDKEVLRFIHSDYSVKTMAAKLGASESTLHRYFKQKYQMSVVEFIREQKLEKARLMLIVDNKSIGEVAYYSGYKHVSNFVTAFKKQFSVTPTELLKHHEY